MLLSVVDEAQLRVLYLVIGLEPIYSNTYNRDSIQEFSALILRKLCETWTGQKKTAASSTIYVRLQKVTRCR